MFQKLAKVRSFGLWLATPQRETVRSQVVACNDNRRRCPPERPGRSFPAEPRGPAGLSLVIVP